ncbi:DUF1554 domain-containing protein [Leptospira abararensis]|uniref:DUF1554 domain-containing protein n=1 Tax=Leptospira abararensis TaxID=2810036 RepID=UPI001E5B7287|nr:DUF1554 domain-containing protein [Leptospira abararensis]
MNQRKLLHLYLTLMPVTLLTFSIIVNCQPFASNNPCDPNSNAFKEIQISKVITKDSSPLCGKDYISNFIPYSVSGSITGLTSSGLKLRLNEFSSLVIDQNSTKFSFINQVTAGSNYSVKVANQPVGLICTVTNGEGFIKNSDINSVSISCVISCNPCRIFLSNSGYAPNPGSAVSFDTLCSTDGNYPGTGTYKAMVVDGVTRRASVSANLGDGQINWIFAPNRAYYQPEGTIGTTSSGGLFISTLTTRFSANSKYWTGLNADWTTNTSNTCNQWSSNLGTYNGIMGQGNSTSVTVITTGWAPEPCNANIQQLICVEQ